MAVLAPATGLVEVGNQGLEEFIDGLKNNLFNKDIFVFTPKGEIINLQRRRADTRPPGDSSCVGARVNGKMVPLNTEGYPTEDRVGGDDLLQLQRPSMDSWAWSKSNRQSRIRQFFKRRGEAVIQKIFDRLEHEYAGAWEAAGRSPRRRSLIWSHC